ncbi:MULTISPECIES: hypothetical protein [Streptomycetaceae]|uniref:hypothetical protein n=1 Tax=Streptomycetaceae TaxID=2062 RepID=UPI000B2684A4|nr:MULTISPECIES: hypothetical protein [Streptomycetaceae]MDQ0309114.1 putative spore protein YtfJ [Kitasatospora herbaricolor]
MKATPTRPAPPVRTPESTTPRLLPVLAAGCGCGPGCGCGCQSGAPCQCGGASGGCCGH